MYWDELTRSWFRSDWNVPSTRRTCERSVETLCTHPIFGGVGFQETWQWRCARCRAFQIVANMAELASRRRICGCYLGTVVGWRMVEVTFDAGGRRERDWRKE